MTEPLLEIPAGGWTVDDLDAFPESNRRYELTDGALTVSPSPSSLHQALAARLLVHLEAVAPEPLAVTQGVEIRFGRQLTRSPDVLVVRSPQPERHWFAPSEVLVAVEIESPGSHLEDRATKPPCTPSTGFRTTDGSNCGRRWSACTASGKATATSCSEQAPDCPSASHSTAMSPSLSCCRGGQAAARDPPCRNRVFRPTPHRVPRRRRSGRRSVHRSTDR